MPPWQLSMTLTIENDATLVAALQQRRRADAGVTMGDEDSEPRDRLATVGLADDGWPSR